MPVSRYDDVYLYYALFWHKSKQLNEITAIIIAQLRWFVH